MHRSRELTEQFTASFVTAAVQCLHHKNATKRQVLRVAVEHDGEEAGRMRSGGVGGNRWGTHRCDFFSLSIHPRR